MNGSCSWLPEGVELSDTAGLKAFAKHIRIRSMEMIQEARSSHLGSVFSAAEILSVLYGRVLTLRPNEPDWSERDRFVMSKGHAAAGLYVALAARGFIDSDRLDTFYQDGGSLAGHVTHKGVAGVEVSTGSLGHGLPLAIGLALGGDRRGEEWRTFCLLSDGECDEGSTWEAALFAGAKRLGRVVAIVDYNKIQSLGRVEDVLSLEPFADKWKSFGWEVTEVDGHDVEALTQAFAGRSREGRPRCVLAHTIKGKGVSFMEDTVLWHYRSPQDEEFALARAELDK